jgi:hypothetical protein
MLWTIILAILGFFIIGFIAISVVHLLIYLWFNL